MALVGSFRPPGDKSITQRLVVAALVAGGRCVVEHAGSGADCQAAMAAARALGAGVEELGGGRVVLEGAGGRIVGRARVDCANSATAMRLLAGVVSARGGGFYELEGDSSLRSRSMAELAQALRAVGGDLATTAGRPPLRVEGRLLPGGVVPRPTASAQVKSAVLLAGVGAAGGVWVAEAAPSRDHTERLLALMGARVVREGRWIGLEPGRLMLPGHYRVVGDISSAAFFLCAAAATAGSRVRAVEVGLGRGRMGFVWALRQMGAAVEVQVQGLWPEPWGWVEVRYTPGLRGVHVPGWMVPSMIDEIPLLGVVAGCARGVSVFEGLGGLRNKESDRLEAVVQGLAALGVRAEVCGQTLVVHGAGRLTPARHPLQARGDHRMAMTWKIATVLAGGGEVQGLEWAAVSYPEFAQQLEELSRW